MVNKSNVAAEMTYPVLAFTPVGVIPYTNYDSLLKVIKHEYEMGWFDNLELVDCEGTCVVVRAAKIAREPIFARVLGLSVDVEIEEAELATKYDVEATRSSVLEFVSIFPEMYESAGVYADVVRKLKEAGSIGDIFDVMFDVSKVC